MMKENTNTVFIACSIDGYIADKNGKIDWLHSIPNPNGNDMGYSDLINNIDAIVMGRKTYETVLSFGIDWPYTKPVFVLSNTIKCIPEELENKVFILNGEPSEICEKLHQQGYHHLYIDGGTTIQEFLKENLIDKMIITTIPILLGGGSPLFGEMDHTISFACTKTEIFLDQVVQNHFKKIG